MISLRTVTATTACLVIVSQLALADPPNGNAPASDSPQFLVDFRTGKKECDARRLAVFDKGKDSLSAAKTATERETIQLSLRADSEVAIATEVKRLFESMKPHAADPAAAEAYIWIARVQSTTDVGAAAIVVLMQHHLIHPQTLEMAYFAKSSRASWVEPMLRAQVASADLPDKQRPKQTLALAMQLQYLAETANGDNAKLQDEAVKLFSELSGQYPNTLLIPGLTIGEVAKTSIFEIEYLSVGKAVPEIEAADLDGVSFKLSDYRGKVVLLSFWGTWCGPCMALVPHERELVEQYKNKPFAIVGVNSDPDKSPLKRALEQSSITWRSFWCGENGPLGPLPREWNIKVWPTVYLIDHEGVIRSKGSLGAKMAAKIEQLVGKAESSAK